MLDRHRRRRRRWSPASRRGRSATSPARCRRAATASARRTGGRTSRDRRSTRRPRTGATCATFGLAVASDRGGGPAAARRPSCSPAAHSGRRPSVSSPPATRSPRSRPTSPASARDAAMVRRRRRRSAARVPQPGATRCCSSRSATLSSPSPRCSPPLRSPGRGSDSAPWRCWLAGEVLVGRATAAVEIMQVAARPPGAAGAGPARGRSRRAPRRRPWCFWLSVRPTPPPGRNATAAQSALTAAAAPRSRRTGAARDRARGDRLRAAPDAERRRALARREPRPDRARRRCCRRRRFGLYAAGGRLQLVGAHRQPGGESHPHPRFFRDRGRRAGRRWRHSPGRPRRRWARSGLLATAGIAVAAPLVASAARAGFRRERRRRDRRSGSPARSWRCNILRATR